VADSGTFNIWACGCSHVHTDIRHGRESLADAIRQSEAGGEQGGPPFDWDVMLHLGDLSGQQDSPQDDHGEEVIRQFGAVAKHRREDIYNLLGNHDASCADEPTQWWFRKWVDPLGENPAVSGVHNDRRPFPVSGTWERYTISIGNMLILMLGDRNDGGPPAGRAERGGYPAGKVTRETFEWWKHIVEANPDKIIVTCHHHMLRETTVASGPWEGVRGGYHGWFDEQHHPELPTGAPIGASYLYFVGDEPDSPAFSDYLREHPGAVDLWLGGHTHTDPDDTCGGRSHIEQKWGVTFINVAALTKYHSAQSKRVPMSRLLSFAAGSDTVTIRCYLHTDDYAPQGWYKRAQREARLGTAFCP